MTETRSRNGSKPETGERGFAAEVQDLLAGDVWDGKSPKASDYETMLDEDAQAQAIELALTLPLRSVEKEIEAAKGGEKEAELVRDVLLKPAFEGGMSTPVDMVILQMAGAMASGATFFEKVWEQDGNNVVYHKIAYRPATTCTVLPDQNGSFNGFIQEGMKNGVYFKHTFTPDKAFVYLHRAHKNPLRGKSLFRPAYRRYEDKKKVELLMFKHLALHTFGILVGTYGGVEGNAGAEDMLKRMSQAHTGGRMVIGEKDKLELLRAAGASEEFRKACEYLNAEMARSVLAQFLVIIGPDSSNGSRALSVDQSGFFLQCLQAILDEIEWHINNYLIPPLVKNNFGENAKYPVWKFQPLAREAEEKALEVFKILAVAAQPNVKPQFLQAIAEKAAQALDIDPEKLKEDAKEPPNGQPPPASAQDGTGNPDGLQRAIGALRQSRVAMPNGESAAPALEEESGDGADPLELSVTGEVKHVWDETKHPRGHHGKFAKKGEGLREKFTSRGFEEATAADRKRLSIPPAWTNVHVSHESDAPLLAVGLDGKGREQRIYSSAHHERQAAAKFERIGRLHERLPEIDKRLSADAEHDDSALAALLIRRMGLRPGSDTDTGAEKKAHGATNLKTSHVAVDGDKIHANFTGKKGVNLDLSLHDPELARLIAGRKKGKKNGDERLLNTDERRLRSYLGKVAPGVKPKDFRTYLGTATAADLVGKMPPPETPAEYRKKRKEVGAKVSELLGNTPTVALASYIAPSVFGPWDSQEMV